MADLEIKNGDSINLAKLIEYFLYSKKYLILIPLLLSVLGFSFAILKNPSYIGTAHILIGHYNNDSVPIDLEDIRFFNEGISTSRIGKSILLLTTDQFSSKSEVENLINKASSYVIQTSNKIVNEKLKNNKVDIELVAMQIKKFRLDTTFAEDSAKVLSDELTRLDNLSLDHKSSLTAYLSSLNLQSNTALIKSKVNKDKLDLEKQILSLLNENKGTYKFTELYKNPKIEEKKPSLIMSTFFSFFVGLMLTILFLLLKLALNPQLVKPKS
jgi:capsular polysaccharide biosynthesis protein